MLVTDIDEFLKFMRLQVSHFLTRLQFLVSSITVPGTPAINTKQSMMGNVVEIGHLAGSGQIASAKATPSEPSSSIITYFLLVLTCSSQCLKNQR